jgi:sugar phosphate isomerase/epimerase
MTTPLRGCTFAFVALASGASFAADGILVGSHNLGKVEHLEAVKGAGFDYVELGLGVLVKQSDEDFERLKRRARELRLPTPTGIMDLPKGVPVTGPHADPGKQLEVVKAYLARARALGMKTVLYAATEARTIPEGFPRDKAFEQLVAAARSAADEARRHGITLVIEPIAPPKTNFINSLAEALSVVKAVKRPNFKLCVDLYHMTAAGEGPTAVLAAAGHIGHAQIARPRTKEFPLDAKEYDYAGLFSALRRAGYRGPVTIDVPRAKRGDFAAQAPVSLALVRRLAASR